MRRFEIEDFALSSYGLVLAASHLRFPLFMEFRAALEHVSLGLLKAAKDSAALDYIARPARGNQVVRVPSTKQLR